LLQAKIFGISFKRGISYLVTDETLMVNLGKLNDYQDFESNWYVDIGYQIFLTWVIMAFHPTMIMPIVFHIKECISERMAQSEKYQKDIEKSIQPM
jgi:hypothetical protein